jgi:hypothetical protein
MYKFNFIEKNEIKLILNKHEFEKDLSKNHLNVKETMKIMKKYAHSKSLSENQKN